MSKILVTGGAGFIGSHVAEELTKRDHEVVVLDDLSGGFPDNLVPGIKLVVGSICDVEVVDRLFAQERICRPSRHRGQTQHLNNRYNLQDIVDRR